MNTDAELLERYANEQEEAAFAELVRRHLPMVYAAALRHVGGDAHGAQDVAQAVFTALARKAAGLNRQAGLAGWLYLATHHAAAALVRGARRRRVREQEAHAMQELMSDSAGGDWALIRPVLDDAMRALSDTDREAVLLRYFEQRAYADVGVALNMSGDAARMRVDRALEKLRTLLGRRGITSTSAALGALLASQAVALPPHLASTITGTALAAGPQVAGIAAGSFSIMNIPFLTLSAVAVVAVGSALFQAREAHRAHAAVTLATQEQTALRDQLRSVRQALAKASGDLAQAQQRLAVASAPAVKTADVAPPLAAQATATPRIGVLELRANDGTVRGSRVFVDTPESRRALVLEAAEAGYAAWFRQLDWNSQQREQFKNFVADKKAAGDQLFREAFAAGAPESRELAQRVTEQVNRDFEARLRAMFGEGVVEALRDFENKKPLRNVADALAKKLFYSDAPLTPRQADQLVDLMAEVARTSQGKIDLEAMNGEAMLVQAQRVLAPSQVAALQELEAQRLRERDLARRVAVERSSPDAVRPAGR